MKRESFAEISAKMLAHWRTLEKLTGLELTLHDYSGIIKLSHEDNLLEGMNYHRAGCCQFPQKNRNRCLSHCAAAAKLRAAEEGKAFTMTCWRGIKELVVPLYKEEHLAGTVFAGAFRDENFDVSRFPKSYRELYRKLPLLEESRKMELETVLTVAGYAMLQLAENFHCAPDREPERIKLIRDFFLYRSHEAVGAGDLAETLDLSESRTLHLLREHFGKGFSQLLNEARADRVAEYLENTQLPLREIAQLTGFRNEYYLNAVFKKIRGSTPGTFRKQSLKN